MKSISMCQTHLSAMELWGAEYGFNLNKGSSLLEVGSGNGLFLQLLKKKGFTDINGVDPNPRHGRKKLNIRKGLVQDLNSEEKQYDYIRSSSVFDKNFYGNQLSCVVEKIHELLAPNGVYFGFEPIESEEIISTINTLEQRANSLIFGRDRHVFIPRIK